MVENLKEPPDTKAEGFVCRLFVLLWFLDKAFSVAQVGLKLLGSDNLSAVASQGLGFQAWTQQEWRILTLNGCPGFLV